MATTFVDLLPGLHALADPAQRSDLARVAALVGLSTSAAHRAITAAIGQSPKSFETETRLQLGALLLVATEARVIDVASACGFAKHETFTRAFSKRFGEPPRQWRAKLAREFTPQQIRTTASISRCMTLYRR